MSDYTAEQLYHLVDRAVAKKDLRALHETGKLIRQYGSERSWLFGYYSNAWTKVVPRIGYVQASKDIGISPKSCQNYAMIVRRFFDKRRKGLLFTHHALLYFLGFSENSAEEMLDFAEEEKLSIPDFSRFLKEIGKKT